jgi:hypothetical protein
MANLTQAQIAMYAQSAGMPNPVLMSAIAMAESGGNPRAHNPVGLDDSYGLWQINMLGAMGPSRRAQFGITSNTQLYDPAVNARAAAKILSGQGLAAWSTYTNGAYKKYIPSTAGSTNATQANWWDDFKKGFSDGFDMGPGPEDLFDGGTSNDPSLSDIPGAQQIGDIATGVGTIAEGVMKAGTWLGNSKNWIRIAYVAGGAMLVGMGLYIVASPLLGKVAAATPGAQAVKNVVKKAAPSKAAPKKAAPSKAAPAKKAASE